ncbi:50S ribosomal protein L1 [Candidatus Parcubacteria bacterium]|nr:MAG: 50S ribosomal protein L1 [Candidatus Parcubacteria bacterium]
MAKIGKRLKAAKAKIDKTKIYSAEEAIKLVKETAQLKFDASIEVHAKLGIDPKKGDQIVRDSVVLPHGSGKKVKVAAFVTEDKAKDAKAAGADLVGGEELIAEIKKTSKADFDVAVTTPDMMPKLAVIAKILGQKGLMPNPKTGTIGPDVKKMVTELKTGKVSYKNDDTANVHLIVGKSSFEEKNLLENFKAFLDSLKKAKPQSVKGTYIRSMYITSSMGPSIKVEIN